MKSNGIHAHRLPPRTRTIKSVWLERWRAHGGVWTRPVAKAEYDLLSGGRPDYTSLNVTKLLRANGNQRGTTLGGYGHQVQVWQLQEAQDSPCERNLIANLF